MTPELPPHGTTKRYHRGCRCGPCRQAICRYEKGRRYNTHRGLVKAIPALGTQRRIQALMALGWTTTEIAHEAGWVGRSRVRQILYGQKGRPTRWVTTPTVAAVAAAFNQLSMKVPPVRSGHERSTRGKARRKASLEGWPPPLAWDNIDDPNETPSPTRSKHYTPTWDDIDDIAIHRRLNGDKNVRLNQAEQDEAWRIWLASGRSYAEFERHTGINAARAIKRTGVAA